LLDEPSLGQDAAHKAMLIHLARALAETGQLVILTTHDLPLAAQADRLMLLGSGGFLAGGPPAEILHNHAAWTQLGLTVPSWVLDPEGQHRALPKLSVPSIASSVLSESEGGEAISPQSTELGIRV
jgi:ABC-type hemin transport system ATPase subunit